MLDEEYKFTLQDRVAKTQSINEQHDLEHNSFVSFSGGIDSLVTHYLLDKSLPGNKIPRVYFNTGIEYKAMVDFVKELAKKDDRFIIINSGVNIKNMLNEYGYPFKSKQHSLILSVYQNQKDIMDCNDVEKIRQQAETKTKIIKGEWGSEDRKVEYKDYHIPKTLVRYLGVEESSTQLRCPQMLLYQFTNQFKIKCSDMCCHKLKKEISKKYQKQSGRTITITGMRKEEGGQRYKIGCIITDKDNNLVKFHPIFVVSKEWEEEFIKRENIELCELYKPPLNFKRIGCVCCPFGVDLQQELNLLYRFLPNEYYKAINVWKPVYDEYVRLGYRLKYYPHEKGVQLSIDDYLEEESQ